jgi:hypothetical protein
MTFLNPPALRERNSFAHGPGEIFGLSGVVVARKEPKIASSIQKLWLEISAHWFPIAHLRSRH